MTRLSIPREATLNERSFDERSLRDAASLRAWRRSVRGKVAFVPTMGYLHEGHLALIRAARARADHVIVSVFVNPTQFNDPADFERYPRDEMGDLQAALDAGADVVFMPTPEVIYPRGSETRVMVGSLADWLCGATRPGHFEGVCTVVMALFQLTQCDLAIFGEKDYQQLAIIRQMTRDLHLPVQIIGYPTVREPDGVAMSSRNARLTRSDRQLAPSIYRGLLAAREAWRHGERRAEALCEVARSHLPESGRLDYLSVCDPITLTPLTGDLYDHESALMAVACHLGAVRLIDNMTLE